MPVKLTCDYCGKEFEKFPCQVNKTKNYCSRKCHGKSKRIKLKFNCVVCGNEFYRYPSAVKSTNGIIYCSKKCLGISRRTKTKVKCLNCGKIFEVFPSRIQEGKGKYCSKKCSDEFRSKKQERTCAYCGKEFLVQLHAIEKGIKRYCSRKCKIEDMVGPKSSNWGGGGSFKPYCHKFNDPFKERVRDFFNRTCMMCGKPEKDNGRRLPVHHVNYEKMVCCDNTPPLFLPVCDVCHSKTNYNRDYWEYILTEFIMIWFDGVSYLPKM